MISKNNEQPIPGIRTYYIPVEAFWCMNVTFEVPPDRVTWDSRVTWDKVGVVILIPVLDQNS